LLSSGCWGGCGVRLLQFKSLSKVKEIHIPCGRFGGRSTGVCALQSDLTRLLPEQHKAFNFCRTSIRGRKGNTHKATAYRIIPQNVLPAKRVRTHGKSSAYSLSPAQGWPAYQSLTVLWVGYWMHPPHLGVEMGGFRVQELFARLPVGCPS
jgi:hypothetical protein